MLGDFAVWIQLDTEKREESHAQEVFKIKDEEYQVLSYYIAAPNPSCYMLFCDVGAGTLETTAFLCLKWIIPVRFYE